MQNDWSLHWSQALLLVSGVCILAGCPQSGANPDDGVAWNNASQGVLDEAAQRDWDAMCAGCHGTFGEGGLGPSVQDWDRGRARLVEVIDERMPTQDPAQCVGPCAERLADYILQGFGDAGSGSCDTTQAQSLPPRRLRLLTRREYDATLRDLFASLDGSAVGASCAQDTSCDLRTQQCLSGSCQALPCGTYGFVWDPGGESPGKVHVAGSFNDWAGTIADGGLAMQYDAQAKVWRAKANLGAGRHEYKIVVDESRWITDAGSPLKSPDGFGGENSAVELNCDGSGGVQGDFAKKWSQRLPAEVRPQHFSFDTHAASALVSSVHVEEYLENGEAIAQLASSDAQALTGCNASDAGCLSGFVTRFGELAFRRPLTGAEHGRYLQQLQSEASLDQGLSLMVQTMLSSPNFLYRAELGVDDGQGRFALDNYEIASALSYGLWGTMPDAELLRAAKAGELISADGRVSQAKRMLQDAKARELMGTFALQWLGVEGVETMSKHPARFPEFNDELRQAMMQEVRQQFNHVIFEGTGSFEELFLADYTMLNEPLAAIYGVSGVQGSQLRKANLPPGQRVGLLGMAAILASTSHSDQTSPVRRGLFVREDLLCQQFPPPPPDAGAVPDVDPNATTRERFRQHSSDPSCNGCHHYIDEVGFGFERFDPVGRWREQDEGKPIDASGSIDDIEGLGTKTQAPFESLPQLAQMLAQSRSAKQCFSRQLYRFVHGIKESAADQCALEQLYGDFEKAEFDVQGLILAIVRQDNFAARRAASDLAQGGME